MSNKRLKSFCGLLLISMCTIFLNGCHFGSDSEPFWLKVYNFNSTDDVELISIWKEDTLNLREIIIPPMGASQSINIESIYGNTYKMAGSMGTIRFFNGNTLVKLRLSLKNGEYYSKNNTAVLYVRDTGYELKIQ